jgi:hypothetical protein
MHFGGAMLFTDYSSGDRISIGGFIEAWTAEKIRAVAHGITLCGTGTKPILNLTISDCGEGQLSPVEPALW